MTTNLKQQILFRGTRENCLKWLADRNIPLGDDMGFYLKKFTAHYAVEKEWEEIDVFDTREEGRKMLAEYRLAFGAGWILTLKWKKPSA